MQIITDTASLQEFCKSLETVPYITVDTEFLREKTYYAKLCLVQVSGPDKNGALIDVIDGEIDLKPLLKLFENKKILKIFHAARQDLEIFYTLFKSLPTPLFDTQIAAMVCGYGDQIGFQPLVSQVTDNDVDKGQQFTDWSKRPLTKKQQTYAMNDVVFLVDVYEKLKETLDQRDRTTWVIEETENLLDNELYDFDPQTAWKRMKIKSPRPRQLAILKEVTAWREKKAQDKDVPRSRILKDETLIDISYNPPETPKDLSRIRNFPKGCETKDLGKALLTAVKKAQKLPEKDCPKVEKKQILPKQYQGSYELLKMVLKICAAENDVAARLIASNEDLQELAQFKSKAKIAALKGWRKKIFGQTALDVIAGKKGIRLNKQAIEWIDI